MHMGIFDSNAFSLRSLTATVNYRPPVPGRLGSLGYFAERGVATTSIDIESKSGKLSLVSSKPRGSTGDPAERTGRKLIPFKLVHLPKTDMVMADEVQNVRAFGTEDQTEAVQTVITDKTGSMQDDIDATIEYHRVGALKGQVLDADGTTVLHDMHDAFAITKKIEEVKFSSSEFDLRNRTRALKKVSKKALGNTLVKSFRAFCGEEFYNVLMADPDTKKAFERQNDGEFLRNESEGGFFYGGVWWEEYADEVNDKPLIAPTAAFFVPEGVAGLFLTRFGPADYMDTVNTIGLPYYANAERQGRKGVELEVQSNPINICTVPGAVLELKL